MPQIPQKLTAFRCYTGTGGNELLGLTDVDLPAFEAMTETIKGAGIAGEYESPVVGHFGSQSVTLRFRSVTRLATTLLAGAVHYLNLLGSIEEMDAGSSALVDVPLRVEIRGQTKGFNAGKFSPGASMETEVTVEASVIRIFRAGVSLVELDKFNMRFLVNGVDYLRATRINTGGV